jgi:hypothetical protein
MSRQTLRGLSTTGDGSKAIAVGRKSIIEDKCLKMNIVPFSKHFM